MKRIYSFLSKLIDKLIVKRHKKREIKKINEKERIKIQNSITLSNEQIKQINDFYKKYYGKKIPLNWHKNYYAISGKFDYKYFPELLFIPVFERLSNSPEYYNCLQDKNITDLIIKGLDYVKMPNVFVRCSNNIYTNQNFEQINFDDALSILDNNTFFIKPTIESSSGKGCRICDIKNCIDTKTGENIKDILIKYGSNFTTQKIVKNSLSISKLHPSSLNTIRVITYILDSKVYHMPILLRMGRNNNFLDNAHAGGIFVGVNDDGSLLEFAHSEFGGNYSEHPDTHVIFKNYYIKNFQKIINTAHKLQALFPQVGCINWDLTLDENEEVVLLEANMRGGSIWLSQMSHGVGAFKENTEEVLKIVKNNKILYK